MSCPMILRLIIGKRRKQCHFFFVDKILSFIAECNPSNKSASTQDMLWAMKYSHCDETSMWLGHKCRSSVDRS